MSSVIGMMKEIQIMTTYSAKPGDIVLVKFPFTDLASTKKRPSLVLNTVKFHKELYLATIAMITSRIEEPFIEGDLILKNWKDCHLLHPSLLRLSKITTIENKLIDKKIGQLQKVDSIQVQRKFKSLFKNWLPS